jgi:hypothetical protein
VARDVRDEIDRAGGRLADLIPGAEETPSVP